MEGLLQSLKFEDVQVQREICGRVGIKAKMSGRDVDWKITHMLFWNGQAFSRFSQEYQTLLDRAFESLSYNKTFCTALLATGDAKLKHSVGSVDASETILTRNEFCDRLTRLRELLSKERLDLH